MYTIGQVSIRTHLSVPVLRAWERRYGIVAPNRTAGGYRMYDEAAIDRLDSMRRMVAGGWTPSAAAAALEAGIAPSISRRPAVSSGDDPQIAQELADRFVAAAERLDAVEMDEVLDAIFSMGTFEWNAERYLMPSLAALGEAWADGRIDVGGEHMASHAVLRRMAAAYEAAGVATGEAGAILVGLPPGARHELGALAFAVTARRSRLPVLYLGPDLPPENWVAAAVRSNAQAAVIGAVTPADGRPAQEVARALLKARPDLLIAFGGRYQPLAAARRFTSRTEVLPIGLPVGLVDSVQMLVGALDQTRAGPPSSTRT